MSPKTLRLSAGCLGCLGVLLLVAGGVLLVRGGAFSALGGGGSLLSRVGGGSPPSRVDGGSPPSRLGSGGPPSRFGAGSRPTRADIEQMIRQGYKASSTVEIHGVEIGETHAATAAEAADHGVPQGAAVTAVSVRYTMRTDVGAYITEEERMVYRDGAGNWVSWFYE